jgi:hypothetical protein
MKHFYNQLQPMPFTSTFKLAHGASRAITDHPDDTTDSKVVKMEGMA